jgi:hypothetical protein
MSLRLRLSVAAVTECAACSAVVVMMRLSSQQRCHNYCGDSYCSSFFCCRYGYCGYCCTVVVTVRHCNVLLLMVRCSVVLELILLVL